jgi:hypothetical protein
MCRKWWKYNTKKEECPKYTRYVQCCWKDVNKVSQKIPQQRVWGEYMKARARKSTPQQRVWGGPGKTAEAGQKVPPSRGCGGGPGKMIRKAINHPPSRRERRKGEGGLMPVIIRIDKCE